VTGAAVTILAPAKLNLGLEVLHRRADGFHEIRTILVAVSIFDRLHISHHHKLTLHADDPILDTDDNLILRAANELGRDAGLQPHARITLRKRIPVAAGLGGASSDAAAVLVALARLWELPDDGPRLHRVAAAIGSDVPFLLTGGIGLASGRGDIITPLRHAAPAYFVVVAPRITIPAKTATLYARLRPEDFSDGRRVALLAASANLDGLPDSSLANAFARPLYDVVPAVSSLPELIRRCGGKLIALSGAGPAHYTVTPDPEWARHITRSLRERLRSAADVFVCRSVGAGALIAGEESSDRWQAQFAEDDPDGARPALKGHERGIV